MPTNPRIWDDNELFKDDESVWDDPLEVLEADEGEEGELGKGLSGPAGLGLGGMEVRLSVFAEAAFRIPDKKGVFAPFSFEGRRHMRQIYDSPAKHMLLATARQVEKCVQVDTPVITGSSQRAPARSITPGTGLCTFDPSNPPHIATGEVVWTSETITKECVRLTTRRGHTLVCGLTHPVRVWGEWRQAGELKLGEEVATVRRLPEPPKAEHLSVPRMDELFWTLLAVTHGALEPVNAPRVQVLVKRELQGLAEESLERLGLIEGVHYTHTLRVPGANPTYFFEQGADLANPVETWVRQNLKTPTLPGWVFELDNEGISLAIRLLWASIGYCGARSNFTLESSHEGVSRGVQTLLWRLGIPTSYEAHTPSHKPRTPRPDKPLKLRHRLRVETHKAKEVMAAQVFSWMKKHPPSVSPPEGELVPVGWVKEMVALIEKGRRNGAPDLVQLGLKRVFDTQYTQLREKKARKYLDALAHPAFDQLTRKRLLAELDGDYIWDRVVKIERVGPQPCVDLQVEGGESFIAGGILTHNSTFLGNQALSLCALIPGYRVLYVSPSSTQTKTFSGDRLRAPIDTSPILSPLAEKTTQNVLEKRFLNQSQIILRSAFLSADRVRGQATYLLLLDEFQDLLKDHIPVIEPSTSHAPPGLEKRCYTGTPKSFDNNIEYYRSGFSRTGPMSTMGEWMVPCEACNFWGCLGERNIGLKGVICERCGKLINPQHPRACWVHQQAGGKFESYRIPQLMVGWMQDPEKWAELLTSYNTYPRAKFYNEVLGLSLDNADRPLMPSDIQGCCWERLSMSYAPEHPSPYIHLNHFLPNVWDSQVFMGIDWGLGTSSHTVVTLGTYYHGVFTIFYIHRFAGLDLDLEVQLDKIIELIRTFNVDTVGADFGFGVHANDRLIRAFGPARILAFQLLNKCKRKVQYEAAIHRCKVFRTLVMSDLINAIKRRQVRFPKWAEFREPYAQDMLNITAEYSEGQRMLVYNHPAGTSDDSFHSYLFCFLASMSKIPRKDILAPLQTGSPGQGPLLRLPGTVDQG